MKMNEQYQFYNTEQTITASLFIFTHSHIPKFHPTLQTSTASLFISTHILTSTQTFQCYNTQQTIIAFLLSPQHQKPGKPSSNNKKFYNDYIAAEKEKNDNKSDKVYPIFFYREKGEEVRKKRVGELEKGRGPVEDPTGGERFKDNTPNCGK